MPKLKQLLLPPSISIIYSGSCWVVAAIYQNTGVCPTEHVKPAGGVYSVIGHEPGLEAEYHLPR